MGTETWIISLPLSDSILYLKIIHPPNFREEPFLLPANGLANENKVQENESTRICHGL